MTSHALGGHVQMTSLKISGLEPSLGDHRGPSPMDGHAQMYVGNDAYVVRLEIRRYKM